MAEFPVSLGLPAAPDQFVTDAARALKEESRNNSKYKKLRCCAVTLLNTQHNAHIFALDVGHAIDFDWTWEGAIAFRPEAPGAFQGEAALIPNEGGSGNGEAEHAWMGEVVEVDESHGRLFVAAPGACPPVVGSFFVQPFDFLFHLNDLYDKAAKLGTQQLLAERLAASRGNIHPEVPDANTSAVVAEHFGTHAWSVLWGPPGTGKTYSTGRAVAAALRDASERILIISTTNRATDGAARSIGSAIQALCPEILANERCRRIGKTVNYERYEQLGLASLLAGTESDVLRQQTALQRQLEKAADPAERAHLRQQLQELRRRMKDISLDVFLNGNVRVVIATAFMAVKLLNYPEVQERVCAGVAPFTTVIIDEAGLISRAATAAMALLAARRVRLVGDSKQLAPISQIARILPTRQATWLAQSGLSHLQRTTGNPAGVSVLRMQHRMHPEVARVISNYQYDDQLTDAPGVSNRTVELPAWLRSGPRALWYVLDEERTDLPNIRAERGPGNRSWVRPVTAGIVGRFLSDESLRRCHGLFITPFRAQAQAMATELLKLDAPAWGSSTVHSQQGAEADVVLFDTVNAGSFAWPYDEWKRLINVALSRAREAVIVFASRAEMQEPYLIPLLAHFQPVVLRRKAEGLFWEKVPATRTYSVPEVVASHPESIGAQLISRKSLRPVMSVEQQRLCGYEMDGKPRLVRGVAGSGKTLVLAHWLQKTAQRFLSRPDAQIWAVYANRSLHGLIFSTVEDAWRQEGNAELFPWHQVKLMHVRDVLDVYLRKTGSFLSPDEFDYDRAAQRVLQQLDIDTLEPCCQALFVDEAQDLGPHTLNLLAALVERADPTDPKSRAVNFFYDNAQNIYGRGTPTWSEMGLDLRGRSTVMKESFRATRPITEFALNVLYRLNAPDSDPDHREIVERGLIEKVRLLDHDWWQAHFSQVEGPSPTLHVFLQLNDEIEAIGRHIVRLIVDEKVRPSDIRVIYNGKALAAALEAHLQPLLRTLNVTFAVQTSQSYTSDESLIIATTAHSFKGYEAEVVIVAGADQFVGGGQVLFSPLYVAMTRARALLSVYAVDTPPSEPGGRILDALKLCEKLLRERRPVETMSAAQEYETLLRKLGAEHAGWLRELMREHTLIQEPLISPNGEIIAQPLFWFDTLAGKMCCFGGNAISTLERSRLEDYAVSILTPGQ